ncbi:MAG: hypothetical protein ACI959_000814 [Limisphaerales bacterium]|jgi:hypothetical protein
MDPNDTFSPQGRIIDESFDRAYTKDCALCLLIRTNKLSYAVYDMARNKFVVHQSAYFQAAKESTSLAEILREVKSVIANDEFLHLSFKQVHIGLGFSATAIIPMELFEEDERGAHLALHTELDKDALVLSDEIKELDAVLEYAIPLPLYEYLQREFEDAQITHAQTGLLKAIKRKLKETENVPDQFASVHIYQEGFTICYFAEGQLVLLNKFEFKSKEDFIYYIMLICEELGINRDKAVFEFTGEIVEHSALFEISLKYLRNVRLGSRPENFSYGREIRELPAQFHFNLFALQPCE